MAARFVNLSVFGWCLRTCVSLFRRGTGLSRISSASDNTIFALALLLVVSIATVFPVGAEEGCETIHRIVASARGEVAFESVRRLRLPQASECGVLADSSSTPDTYRCIWRYADLDGRMEQGEKELLEATSELMKEGAADEIARMMKRLGDLSEKRSKLLQEDFKKLSSTLERCFGSWGRREARSHYDRETRTFYHTSWKIERRTGESIGLQVDDSRMELVIQACDIPCSGQ